MSIACSILPNSIELHIGIITFITLYFRQPLSQRSYLSTHGLRSTVAWILGQLADIHPGHTVLDPMCGAGTIVIEASKANKVQCLHM